MGLVPLLIESQVDDRERNMIGESPMKLGGRDVRFFCYDKHAMRGKWKKREENEKNTMVRCRNSNKEVNRANVGPT